MTNMKLYITGAFLLIVGALIGWFARSGNSHMTPMDHGHSMEALSSGPEEEIWTCSMHPQIRQNEPGICPICEMDLIPLDNSMSNDDPTILQMSTEAAKLAQVETTVVGDHDSHSSVSGTRQVSVEGTVKLDDRTITVQSAHVGGRIESISVNFEGQYITKGSKIATIYSTELLQASQELLTAIKFENKVNGIKDASIQKLKNWKISDSDIQGILETGQPIETIDIYAEESGYILERKSKLGDYVPQGAPLYTLGKTSRVWLVFNVYESDMDKIKRGQTVTFTSPSIGQRRLSTRISYIDPILDQQTRTAKARAEISNANGQLKPGMLITGQIELPQEKSKGDVQVTIPNSAILWTGEQSVVYVQLPDEEVPTYQYREVNLGTRMDDFTIVTSGLEIGERVVTNGAFAVDAAAQLNNSMSMMNKSVTIKKEASSDRVPNYVSDTPEEFRDQLDVLVTEYVLLKDALVQTNAATAAPAARTMLSKLESIDMTLLTGDPYQYWMDQISVIKGHGQKIVDSEEVEEQRDQFDFLSTAIINSLRAFGTNDKTYYVQYCPMAKDNAGASWIAMEKQIQNPYFGDKMMKCGSIKLEL